ncbi:MAG: HAMP domain-containing histidine kinase [Planctomycetes bacterium]|nr:HAMP domain-containing histidine kinase [Planctomycetota bacterium]
MNVSATLVTERLRRSRLDHLTRAVDIITRNRDDLVSFFTQNEQGKQMPAFLDRTAKHLADEQAALIKEMEQVTVRVEHIKTIVQTQQSYAGVLGAIEMVDAAVLLDDAVKLNAAAMERHKIQIERDYEPGLWVSLDKQKLVQVLVNLIKNAKEAVQRNSSGERRVTVRARIVDAARLQIEIIDSGEGIATEHLTRIFSQGFTTKKNGHGFGLHSSANAVKEMGGSLQAHSDGPGSGAAFTLELPYQPPTSRGA